MRTQDQALARISLVSCSDGWTLLEPGRPELGHRYLEIMQQMNRATYSPDHPERIVRRMSRPPCEYFHFAGNGFELALGLKWNRRLKRFRVMSTGFVGQITPREALDHIAVKLRAFAQSKGVDRVVAIRPRHMDSPAILELYELLFSHHVLNVRGGHWLNEGEYLWIDFWY